MRLISVRFPAAFPFHPNWKKSVAHRLYWDISASLDHVVPVSRGGPWNEPENLVTACSRCQYQKRNLPLDVLGWALRFPAATSWDGGVSRYRRLWETLGCPVGNHPAWIAAFERAYANTGWG
jgi:hypothetical protein